MSPALTRKRKADLEMGKGKSSKVSDSSESSKNKKLPVRAKDEDATGEQATVSKQAEKGSLKVFGDDDSEEPINSVSAASVSSAPVGDKALEEDEESDDDAPEAVSTQKVASQIKQSANEAQKAAQEQAAAQKRKRQQRDTLLKQQAQERRQAEAEAAKQAVVDEDSRESTEEDVQIPTAVKPSGDSLRERRQDRAAAPTLLPVEFLTDSSGEDSEGDDDDDLDAEAKPKKRKISTIEKSLSRQDRAPRDVMAGSTLYRVAKKVDASMAPKARKGSKGSRESLLRRNRSAVKPHTGFFKRT
ncbi:hypothetical protein S7711_07682 [Stachybotrys chartarum IBT 7711]|uniref:Uncharacterized protein n=1 Tax=Stachybotrys chartarum (strain CBS 109288 / IBT 7711) TaxID=1280523 RepID=A0A084AWG3_STACB|nr:hypothetical protein S7711_07682 [Stachybotrys chartarum IBT 7711]KFA52001.1 hypothetical protein S40293_07731 [Stachybotrys chartarum IBT 40293]KFA80186.1 hypothetical protein S40288_07318 [Stachybotrys chartarum IBT 40288]